jgi:hypothetical protein
MVAVIGIQKNDDLRRSAGTRCKLLETWKAGGSVSPTAFRDDTRPFESCDFGSLIRRPLSTTMTSAVQALRKSRRTRGSEASSLSAGMMIATRIALLVVSGGPLSPECSCIETSYYHSQEVTVLPLWIGLHDLSHLRLEFLAQHDA